MSSATTVTDVMALWTQPGALIARKRQARQTIATSAGQWGQDQDSGSVVKRLATCNGNIITGPVDGLICLKGTPTVDKEVEMLEASNSEDDHCRDPLAYRQLTTYLGGSTMSQDAYEERFGVVNKRNPFGGQVWQGLRDGWQDYVQQTNKTWLLGYNVWLGAFAKPLKFSKSVAKMPADRRGLTVDSGDLYPGLFMLTNDQDITVMAAKRAQAEDDDSRPTVICTPTARLSARGEPDAEPETGVARLRIDEDQISNVYMVCLKIMIARPKPWEVNMDWVHLHSWL
jgi:hypothetical protein